MGKINYGRVVLGGIVAGIVFLALDFAGMYILPFDWDAWIAQYNLTMPSMALWVVMDILFGILAVWLYAAIRPRFSPGVKTAVIAGVFLWLFGAIMWYGFAAMGMFEMNAYLAMAGWSLVQMIVATTAGAWMYKEEGGGAM